MHSILRSNRFRNALAALCYAAVLAVLPAATVRAQDVVTVAAASDLKFALDEIAAELQSTTPLRLRLTYGASGVLFTQINQGAPFDLFLSADESLVFQLADRGMTRDRGAHYATGRLALFVPNGSTLKADAALDDLTRAVNDGRIRRFAIANPEHAPYGRAAREVLIAMNLWDAISQKLVLGENVAQAAQFAVSGSAHGGRIGHSLALAPTFAQRGSFVVVPESLHPGLRQRMVLTKRAGANAETLYKSLQGAAARAILVKYGFTLPEK